MADIFKEINVKDFGATGDGQTNDAPAILSAITSPNNTILFPEGIYRLTANVYFPSSKTIVFERGAALDTASGVVVTVNADIRAGLFPIFTGAGTYNTNSKDHTIYPQWFGGSAEGDEQTGIVTASASIAAGSRQLAVPAVDKNKFANGHTVMVLHAGTSIPSTFPNPAPAPTLTYYGTPGTTTYRYRIAILDKNGGITAASEAVAITSAASQLSFREGNKIRITMPALSGSQRHGFVVYGEPTNPEGSRGILALLRDVTAYWEDGGLGSIEASTPPWIPIEPPSAKLNNTLLATIDSGGGTATLTLSAAAGATVNGNAVILMDNAGAFNRAYSFLGSGGGGTLKLPYGVYNLRLDPNTARSVFFVSNVRTIGVNKPICLMHVNPSNDLIRYFTARDNSASDWSFEGIVFDGGNRTYTTEYYQVMFETLGTIGHSRFLFKDNEFRYSRGKFIQTYSGNCTDYQITGNYFHHGCSNALGIGGHRFRVDNNLFQDIFFGYGGTKVGGAECIIIRNTTNGSSDLTSYGDIIHNTISNYGTINFGGGTARYLNINISYNQILGYDNAIGLGGNMDNISVVGNQISIQNLGYLHGQAIKFELSTNGLSATDILISGNHINVNADPETGLSSNGISASVNPSNLNNVRNIRIVHNTIQLAGKSGKYPVEIYHMKNVLFSGNYLETDNAALDSSLYTFMNNAEYCGWIVSDNVSPGKNLHIPAGSIVQGNQVGGLRIQNNTVVSGNSLTGIPTTGPTAWGGIINLAGSDNVVLGNRIDLSGHYANAAAVNQMASAANNMIANNLIKPR
ncbi:glycosyl hydrolase family 28-related protein [Cohnella lubricantis]|uniref:Rhamnogalacturonase A/B/Epimerase-like pectate lyase domain-containing protein n=1 Tax=Cohnella lubricantis TaxID=2163172 RepID=A0A841T9V5_9BACL|nr:glycosyl hydrolase family 28-related protein [Cohnella lubricantis]MBB6676829.1 hypothetical protein [Cohnella lubricantis]MBP2119408.1 hypothetical protein [Cohnella lubricantis]